MITCAVYVSIIYVREQYVPIGAIDGNVPVLHCGGLTKTWHVARARMAHGVDSPLGPLECPQSDVYVVALARANLRNNELHVSQQEVIRLEYYLNTGTERAVRPDLAPRLQERSRLLSVARRGAERHVHPGFSV